MNGLLKRNEEKELRKSEEAGKLKNGGGDEKDLAKNGTEDGASQEKGVTDGGNGISGESKKNIEDSKENKRYNRR